MMASRALASTALLISLNLLFFTLVSSCDCQPPSSNQPKPPSKPSPNPNGKPKPSPNRTLKPSPNPNANPKPSPSSRGKCPRDALKLRLCANVLGGLVHVVLGPQNPCCSLVNGLVDLDAAVCLCTVIKADLLGIKLKVPVDLSVLLNSCGKDLPKGFQC